MNKVFIIFICSFILTSTTSCSDNRTKKASDNVSLTLTSIREYTVPCTYDDNFKKITDTLIQKRFDIGLSIKNLSDDPISIWIMTCSWEENILINNNYIHSLGTICDGNCPAPHTIKSPDSLYLTRTLARSLRVDNPSKYGIGSDNIYVATTKLGLIYIDTTMCSNRKQYFSTIGDRSKWDNIIWSNPLYLNKK